MNTGTSRTVSEYYLILQALLLIHHQSRFLLWSQANVRVRLVEEIPSNFVSTKGFWLIDHVSKSSSRVELFMRHLVVASGQETLRFLRGYTVHVAL